MDRQKKLGSEIVTGLDSLLRSHMDIGSILAILTTLEDRKIKGAKLLTDVFEVVTIS